MKLESNVNFDVNFVISSVLRKKYDRLLDLLLHLKSAAVGFSGGVDSTFLLHAAKQALGENVSAVTLATPYIPRWEIEEARQLARSMNVRHQMVDVPFPEAIRNNPPERCYICKKMLFSVLIDRANIEGFSHVLDGTHIDDLDDERPGLRALKELQVKSPLKEACLTKEDIRVLSHGFGFPTWDKPAFACLMTRIPTGERVEEKTLRRIEAAEVFLMQLGFPAVRLRSHGDLARIEVPENRIVDLIAANRKHCITEKLREMGYRYVTVDIAGYRMGSLNASILKKEETKDQ